MTPRWGKPDTGTMKPETLVQNWIGEDHETFRRSVQRLCTAGRGLATAPAFANAETMLAALKTAPESQKPDVLLLDVGLPGRSGPEIIADVHKHAPQCRIRTLPVFEDEDTIGRAIRPGARGPCLKHSRARTAGEAHF